jgi:hypothetical protein
MKVFSLSLLLLAASSANATHFKCTETAESPLLQKRLQYSVFVTTVAPITDRRIIGRNDSAEKVRISLLSRNPKFVGSPFKLDRPSFEAVAKTADVSYQIDALKTHGFGLYIFLDELDQTSMKLSGVRGSVRMNCHSTQN